MRVIKSPSEGYLGGIPKIVPWIISSVREAKTVNLKTVLVYLLRTQKFPKGNINIGKHTGGILYIFSWPNDTVTIGKYTSIGPDMIIIPNEGHKPAKGFENRRVSTFQVCFMRKNLWKEDYAIPGKPNYVKIGNDVWIGARAVILSAVTIGDGAIVGANAVVTKDIPPYAIAVGVPAKVIRYRCSEEQAQKLQQIAWWDWPEEKITENLDCFYGGIDRFIERFYHN